MKQRTRFWILITLLLVAAIGVAGYYWIVPTQADQETQTESNQIETAVARIGDLLILASGSGQVVPASEVALGFDESGMLTEVLVNLGDKVQAGDVIARMQTQKTEAQIAAELASAELAVVQAQQARDELYRTAELDAAQAWIAVDQAQQALDALLDVAPEQAEALQNMANAQKAVDDAKMSLYILNSSPSQDAIETAYASLLFKEQTLKDLQDQVKKLQDQIKTAPNEDIKERLVGQLQRLNVQLAQQQLEVDKSQYKYDTLDDPANSIDLAVAQTRLTTAQAQLEDAQRQCQAIEDGPAPGDVALAKVALAEVQAEWERIKDGPDPEEVATVETNLEKAKLELQIKQQEKTVVELITPMDGTVVSISADVGERIGTQTLITIADLSQPYLEIFIDETDLDKIQVGNPVEVTFEALPDDIFDGNIIEVNPGLVQENRVQAIRALVRLDAASYAKPVSLPIGLNASVDVTAGKATNAVLIPYGALRQINPGEYEVYVMVNNLPEPRPVSVGLTDYNYAEILSGLEAGEIVVTGNVGTE